MWLKQILTPKRDRLRKRKKKKKEDLTSVSLRVSSRNPKQDLGGLKYWRFADEAFHNT